MSLTLLLAQIIGPVLLLRGLSIVIDRKHFLGLLDRLEEEAGSVSFSLFPIALLMAGIAVAVTLDDTSSLAATLLYLIAWGMILKASLLILFPTLVAQKARLLGQAGFLNVVLVVCFAVGAYFTWFGYFAPVVD